MSHRRVIWEEVSQLATRIAEKGSLGSAELDDLVEHLGRLARLQFKSSALQESALQQQKDTLNVLQATIARQDEMIAALQNNHRKDIELARHDLLLTMLPGVDGLEAAMDRAGQQLAHLREGSETRAALAGWLDGLRLVHQRLMDVLARAGVQPVDAVGQLFDPSLHVASGVDISGRVPAGTIVAEERRGYRTRDGMLRYAEVVVSRPPSSPAGGSGSRPAAEAAR
jgi:molecular chaperone GrpE